MNWRRLNGAKTHTKPKQKSSSRFKTPKSQRDQKETREKHETSLVQLGSLLWPYRHHIGTLFPFPKCSTLRWPYHHPTNTSFPYPKCSTLRWSYQHPTMAPSTPYPHLISRFPNAVPYNGPIRTLRWPYQHPIMVLSAPYYMQPTNNFFPRSCFPILNYSNEAHIYISKKCR